MTSTDLAEFQGFLDVQTGEILPATVGNAALAIRRCRESKELLNRVVDEATRFLAAAASHVGTKTLRDGDTTVTLTGGTTIEYDAQDLMEALRAAGCPEDRIEQCVVPEISYRVNRSVVRQLAGANEDYRAAIDLATRTIEKPYRAKAS